MVGHIAKFCRSKAFDGQTASLSTTTEDKNLVPAQRTIVEVEIETMTINLLYDTGWQFSIITQERYDSLPVKPPLHRITQSGIGIDGHKFDFSGVAYLTINFKKNDGGEYPLFYEPFLVSSQVKTNILGAKTEARFQSCTRNLTNNSLVYTTPHGTKINVPCFKERLTFMTAFIEVAKAKATVILDKEIKFVKGKVKYERSQTESGNQQHYVIGDCISQSGSEFLVPNITINEVDRNITIPIENVSGKPSR